MPNIKVSVPYQLPQDEALSRIRVRLRRIKAQYAKKVSNLTENWDGYVGSLSGSGSGFSVSGNIVVKASVVSVELAVPLGAMFIKGKIESTIRDQLTQLLS